MAGDPASWQRAHAAEMAGAPVRLLTIFFTLVTYHALVDKTGHAVLPAYALLAGALGYGVYVGFGRPFEKVKTPALAWLTAGFDSIFIAAFVYATGGVASPYHLLFLLSIVGVAFRFDFERTIAVAGVYVIGYIFVCLLHGVPLLPHLSELVIRSGFILLTGGLAGLLADEAMRQAEGHLMRKAEVEALLETIRASSEAQAETDDLEAPAEAGPAPAAPSPEVRRP